MTIKDIARESGYAVGTVSRVLNHHPEVSEAARIKIMEVVEKHHFRLNNNAKHLKQQSNNGIALIVKGAGNMLFAAMVENLQELIKEKGYACLIYYIDETENEVEQALLVCNERQPKGILFLGGNLENFKQQFSMVDVPCVLVTISAKTLNFDNLSSVSIDDETAAFEAVSHLVSLGHRNIVILGGEMDYSNPARARFNGCLRAFEKYGILFDQDKQSVSARFAMSDGYKGMLQLLDKKPELTAVFAMSDVMALGAIRAIKDRGLRIPQDVSVVGFDGIELSQYLIPKLTTIQQPNEELARYGVEILLRHINGEREAFYAQVPFCLVEGESTDSIAD